MAVEKHYICTYQNPNSSIKFFILSDYDFEENPGLYRFITSRERIEFWLNFESEERIKDTEKIFQHLLNGMTKSQGVNQITYCKGSQRQVEIKHYYPPLRRRVFHDDSLERAYRIRRFRERIIT